MRTAFSTLALVVAGSSVAAVTQSHSPTTHARALGMRALRDAQSQMYDGRKMEGMDDNDWGDMMAGMVTIMCGVMETDEFKVSLEEGLQEGEVEGGSITCPVFGCDQGNVVPNLIMECSMDGVFCEEDEETNEEFCITDIDVQLSMGLNYGGESLITSIQCSNYTSPQYMVDMGRACSNMTVTMNMGDMMDDILSGKYDPETLTEDEATAAALEYVEIIECSIEFGNGTACSCGLCNENKGYHYACDNHLVSNQECINFDPSATDMGAIANGDNIEAPAVAVTRLLPEEVNDKSGALDEDEETFTEIETDEASHAAPCKEAAAAGIMLVFSSLLALM